MFFHKRWEAVMERLTSGHCVRCSGVLVHSRVAVDNANIPCISKELEGRILKVFAIKK
jgi:hypothetical protein